MPIFELTLLRRTIPSSMYKVAQAAIIVAGATAIVKFVAFIKEAVVARFFGLSREMDAFVIAYSVVSFLVGILISTIQASLIPWLCGLDDRKAPTRDKMVNQALTITVLVATVFAFALFLSADWLITLVGYALPEQSHHLAAELVKVFSVSLFFVVINAFFHSILQKRKHFLITGLTPVFTPLAVVMSIVLFTDDYGIYTLAVGAVGGAITETSILLLLLTRLGACPRLTRPRISADLRNLMSQSWVMIVGAALMGSTLLVDRSMASTLGVGAVSALAYASRVPSLIDSLGATAIATAVLPYFSDMVSRKDWTACRQHLKVYAWVLFLVSFPVMLALVYASGDIVRLIFQRGEFTAQDTALVSSVQQMYLLAIPPFIIGMVAVRMLSALSMNYVLTLINISNVIINVALNIILRKRFGAAGIALSTVFVYLNSTFFCLYFAFRGMKRKEAESRGICRSVSG